MSRIARAVVIGVVLILILMVGLTLLIPFAWGRGFGFGMLGRGMMGGFGFPLWFTGGIGMLLFWVLIIVGVIWIVQSPPRGTETGGSIMPVSESPLDILKRRYAKGEISKEQFEEIKRDLGG